MAQGKKTSSKDKAKIIKGKVKNPDASLRDLEKETGVKKDTIAKVIKKDLPEVAKKSEIIAKIIDNDKEILSIGSKLTLDNFRQLESKKRHKLYDIKTVNEIMDKAKSRLTLLGGDVTDENGGLKSIEEFRKLSDDELKQFL